MYCIVTTLELNPHWPYHITWLEILKYIERDIAHIVCFYFIPIHYVQVRVIAPVTTHTQSLAFSWMKFHMARNIYVYIYIESYVKVIYILILWLVKSYFSIFSVIIKAFNLYDYFTTCYLFCKLYMTCLCM